MVSSTQRTERIRRRKRTTNGKVNKRVRRAMGTPAFAIHQVPAVESAVTATATATTASV